MPNPLPEHVPFPEARLREAVAAGERGVWPVVSDLDIYRAANMLIERYGVEQ